ncbi:MAG: radical SAM protein [Deltaproteobacteria bacterium]|nr:radical SAM protein [Deltaproteobacteria bacterium]
MIKINPNPYQTCTLCPRQCKINRLEAPFTGLLGFCGESAQLRIGYVGPHFGEEPPITGKNGSGTVFLSGCSLKCCFCQNHQISREGMGVLIADEALFHRIKEMIRAHHVHNINFVTPDQFVPDIFKVISLLRQSDLHIPIVFNTSGYQSINMLKQAEDYVDIYLPDFKYSDTTLAAKFSNCPDYPQTALNALSEMLRQKGFLDSCRDEKEIATEGVLVRHLILPGHTENSINALSTLFIEFGKDLPISLMSQYHPVGHQDDEGLNRSLLEEEFVQVYTHVLDLGFENLFVQFLDKNGEQRTPSPFLPDFRTKKPFGSRV